MCTLLLEHWITRAVTIGSPPHSYFLILNHYELSHVISSSSIHGNTAGMLNIISLQDKLALDQRLVVFFLVYSLPYWVFKIIRTFSCKINCSPKYALNGLYVLSMNIFLRIGGVESLCCIKGHDIWTFSSSARGDSCCLQRKCCLCESGRNRCCMLGFKVIHLEGSLHFLSVWLVSSNFWLCGWHCVVGNSFFHPC